MIKDEGRRRDEKEKIKVEAKGKGSVAQMPAYVGEDVDYGDGCVPRNVAEWGCPEPFREVVCVEE